jgi:hypothetical protein
MKKTDTLVLLENLCKTLSINVKYDRFFGRGGYCRLKEKSFFIINERLSNETKEQIFINELKSFDLGGTAIPSKLKELLIQ